MPLDGRDMKNPGLPFSLYPSLMSLYKSSSFDSYDRSIGRSWNFVWIFNACAEGITQFGPMQSLELYKNQTDPVFVSGPFSHLSTTHNQLLSAVLFVIFALLTYFVHGPYVALSQTNALLYASSYLLSPFLTSNHRSTWFICVSNNASNCPRSLDGTYIWPSLYMFFDWICILSCQKTIDLRDYPNHTFASDDDTDTQTVFEAERPATLDGGAEQISNNSIKVCPSSNLKAGFRIQISISRISWSSFANLFLGSGIPTVEHLSPSNLLSIRRVRGNLWLATHQSTKGTREARVSVDIAINFNLANRPEQPYLSPYYNPPLSMYHMSHAQYLDVLAHIWPELEQDLAIRVVLFSLRYTGGMLIAALALTLTYWQSLKV